MALKETGKVKEAEDMVIKLISDLKKINTQSGNTVPGDEQKISSKNNYIISLGYDFLGDKESAKRHLNYAMDKKFTVAFDVMFDASYIPQEK